MHTLVYMSVANQKSAACFIIYLRIQWLIYILVRRLEKPRHEFELGNNYATVTSSLCLSLPIWIVTHSARDVEYTDCFSAEG